MKDKHLSIRISDELYQKYVEEAIKRSNTEKRIVKVSEIIREKLERNLS
jgi:predicted DNA-binding protein